MRVISVQRFLDQIYEGYYVGKRYCFIIGSGASRSSGIRTGLELMKEWFDYLWDESRGQAFIKECAEDLIIDSKTQQKSCKTSGAKSNKLTPDYYARFLNSNYELKSTDYFDLFDLRFVTQRDFGYYSLEKEMENKSPSYGYFALATILANTDNRLVITTNFDSLAEDAMFIYTKARPQVVGHESLAQYMVGTFTRPVIAKIHRGLFFRPLNRKQELSDLSEEWKRPLQQAFERYIPIVIGYGGGDHTLMSFLESDELKLENIYWCDIHSLQPESQAAKLLDKRNGTFLKISGFDEIMFDIGERFNKEANFNDPTEFMKLETERRCREYQDSFQELKSNKALSRKLIKIDLPSKGKGSITSLYDDFKSPFLRFVASQINQIDEALKKNETSLNYLNRARLFTSLDRFDLAINDVNKAIAMGRNTVDTYMLKSEIELSLNRFEDAEKSITEAIKSYPTSIDSLKRRGDIYLKQKKYDLALRDIDSAILIKPSDASLYRLRAAIYEFQGQQELATKDIEYVRYIEMQERNDEDQLLKKILERYAE